MTVPVYFISIDKVKTHSYINENVDEKLLAPLILNVQDMYLHPILGTALYKDIKSQITANMVSSDYDTLLKDCIHPVLIWYIMAEAPEVISFRLTNKGVAENSDNSTTMQDLLSLSDRYRNKAEWYAERLVQYLNANINLYPKYNNQQGEGTDAITSKANAYTGGWYLGSETEIKTTAEEKYQR